MPKRPLVFISYRHGDPWTELTRRLQVRLKNVSKALGFDLFIDEGMGAGVMWAQHLQQQLQATTHFVCVLCDEYWESIECQRELMFAVESFRATGEPRLLFVLAEAMSPEYLTFDDAGRPDRLGLPGDGERVIQSVSDVNFLGPFDGNLRLEPLSQDSAARFAEQLTQLVKRLKETLPTLDTQTARTMGSRP
ncbi:toll/interleukin-1 receptor domain-containing protein [Paraburkholderia fynbosensis]|uniref:TIR domain-containing protein n=1 Tax=Paraburkholderia fynbosensis TaxID=1200993 RepID=A0A6J5GL28_9BURK|nr:toll/interleukin-1 receptor domain-containing protein [Paraburkholderia fynbosensis]CAB3801340.1 hypothetical protein LMG27177_05032 [Paraburkholderia fynbosensis]